MKSLKLAFSDMWGYEQYVFNEKSNYFISLLSLYYEIEIVDNNPDVLIFSCFGEIHRKHEKCLKIFFCGENSSPPGVSRMIRPDYSLCDLSLTHFQSTDRNFYFPLWILFVNWFCEKMPIDPPTNPSYLVEIDSLSSKCPKDNTVRRNFCSFMNNNPIPDRIDLFNKLNIVEEINSYGKLFNNTGGPLRGAEYEKLEILKTTCFSIEYENSYAFGYNTEKVLQAYSQGAIAIYSGGLDRTVFNSRALFYLHDYPTQDEMISDILRHRNDTSLFELKQQQALFINDHIPDRVRPMAVLDWLRSRIDHFLEPSTFTKYEELPIL